ncbi:YSC84-related protein [Burkholderia ubonensis]|uniref:lipid-binding SYLF domain-containing protein n=1 Tax=Burkholderia ubonensis TaxID=101571 RepID=UPI0007522C89|nr:lipid-binding SYLF domain-containing protein [Burkholderia ubonensis]KVP44326.1 twin-arginine translocation pathway signal protein [Burkholderia ubonensis]
MFDCVRKLAMVSLFVVMAACSTGQSPSASGSSSQDVVLDQDTQAALANLYAGTPQAKDLAQKAKGILVFPSVVRAGFIAGASHGTGELIENGKVTGYYATTSVTYGLQAGVQTYGYVMMFMSDKALDNLKTSSGFEVGMAPTVVVGDTGAAKNLTTTTLKSDIYAFIFNQKGLMAGIGLRGSKITRLDR